MTRVADSGGIDSDPDSTSKVDPDPTLKKHPNPTGSEAALMKLIDGSPTHVYV